MVERSNFVSGLLLCLSLFLVSHLATPSQAALDIDFGASVQIGDDTEVYFAISSRYYDRDEQDVRRWHRKCADPDDLAVALFIARHGRRSPDSVLTLRAEGLSWWEISLRLGVPAEVWFVPVKGDPGPPYGKAYGHWKKHGKNKPARMAISDGDARNLVAVRLLHDYYGVSAEIAMAWRSSGKALEDISAEQYRGRHGKNKVAHGNAGSTPAGNPGMGQGGGKSGKGKKK